MSQFLTTHESHVVTRDFRNPLGAYAIGKNEVFAFVVRAGLEKVSCDRGDNCTAIAIC
jgi:hypothetical protein